MFAGILPGVGQRGSYQGTLATAQVFGLNTEMCFCHGRGPVDAVAHLYRIEIYLHDALLRPKQFDECGEVDLEALARPTAPRPQEYILGRLLRDGRGTELASLWMLPVTLGGMLDGLVVEAVMRHKVGIFAGNDGYGQVGRYFPQGHPMVAQPQFLALASLLRQTDEHQRREVDGEKAKRHHRQNSGAEEGRQYPAYGDA